jgi:hypothetical protein
VPVPTRLLPAFDACVRARLAFARRGAPKGLLIVRSGGLGDTVLFAPQMDRFRALAEPGEPVAVLTPRASRKTAFLLGDDVEVIGVDYPRFLREAGYRAVVQAMLYRRGFRRVVSTDHLRHPLIDEAMIRACAAPVTEALSARPWPKHQARLDANRGVFSRLIDAGPGPGMSASMPQRWAHLANALTGGDAPPPLARIPDDRLPDPEPCPRPTVVMQPYSAVAEKQPAPALWGALIDALGPDVDVVVTGGPGDRAAHPAYEILFERPGVRFDGRGFQDIVPLLRAARCVVSADTALMHLAVACGAPTLGLASAAYVGDLVPYPDAVTPPDVRFLHTPMACEGCLGKCVQPLEDARWACVARLDADAAVATMRALMAEKESAP